MKYTLYLTEEHNLMITLGLIKYFRKGRANLSYYLFSVCDFRFAGGDKKRKL